MGAHRLSEGIQMEDRERSLKSLIEQHSGEDDHLLFQAGDKVQAVEVARRIHEGSSRVGKPFVIFDARDLADSTPRDMLNAFGKGPNSPVAEVDGGTLVILHMEETPEDFQHVFAKVIDQNPSGTGQRLSGQALLPLDARVILIEPPGDKTYTDIRHNCNFEVLERYDDDL
jgi:transcriptional regulator of acetoin/glycerol metabolism